MPAQLIDELYVRYKDHVVHHIRDDEQTFNKVQRDIFDIEHGGWDQRLLSRPAGLGAELGSVQNSHRQEEPTLPRPVPTPVEKQPVRGEDGHINNSQSSGTQPLNYPSQIVTHQQPPPSIPAGSRYPDSSSQLKDQAPLASSSIFSSPSRPLVPEPTRIAPTGINQAHSAQAPKLQSHASHPFSFPAPNSSLSESTPSAHAALGQSIAIKTSSTNTPLRQPPPAPLIIPTPTSSTPWKPPDDGIWHTSPRTPTEPPYSPLSDVGRLSSEPHLESSMVSQIPDSDAAHPPEDFSDSKSQLPSPSAPVSRTKVGSGTKNPNNGALHTSVPGLSGSSGMRTASQSILSPVEGSAITLNQALPKRIKKEPLALAPVNGGEGTDSISPTTRDETPRYSTRSNKNTPDEDLITGNNSVYGKRKRPTLEPLETPEAGFPSEEAASGALDHHLIRVTRNFPRTTAPLLNAIGGHKFASLFAAPVKEKNAPGYRDIIYLPQDLKSIKAAIANGSKAVNKSILPENTASSPGQTGSVSSNTPFSAKPNSTLWIPANSNLVPPKGIVNSAQLEKELMRMFANAVMFNPDPNRRLGVSFAKAGDVGDDSTGEAEHKEYEDGGGVVKDAREMFEVVEKTIADWRAAERTADVNADRFARQKVMRGMSTEEEEDRMTDTIKGDGSAAGVEMDEESGGPPKRRKRF